MSIKARLAALVKKERKKYKLSQVDLVHKTKVSLPTIQNIESLKYNPSVDILEKILTPLGYRLEFVPIEPDWGYLSQFGLCLYLETPVKKAKFNKEEFVKQLLITGEFLKHSEHDPRFDRNRDSYLGLLHALKTHYPSIMRSIEKFLHFNLSNIDGRIIKLRRMSLSIMGKYL